MKTGKQRKLNRKLRKSRSFIIKREVFGATYFTTELFNSIFEGIKSRSIDLDKQVYKQTKNKRKRLRRKQSLATGVHATVVDNS